MAQRVRLEIQPFILQTTQSEAITRWKPWENSTRPKSPEGKATVSGNAWAGGEWLKLQQAIKALNQAMRQQKEWQG